ncbi:unnamed protein product [Meloidogyne enterolobii]|uniref:Uncharacterized protein n=1 Tax=Meloidogyne enterolobii TaxID=390850 RepID=A0ACB0XQJ7_MELEN
MPLIMGSLHWNTLFFRLQGCLSDCNKDPTIIKRNSKNSLNSLNNKINKKIFRNQQEDMLLLQPRRRRLMSTATGPEMSGGAHSNKAFHFDEFYRDKAPVVSDDDENNNNIVPVYNHNPSRRISVVYNDGGGPTRILDSIKRKFSRAAPTGGSRSGEHDFEKSFERTQRQGF